MTCILVVIANPKRAPLDAPMVAELGRRFAAEPRWLAEAEAADMVIDHHDEADVRTLAASIIGDRGDPSLVCLLYTSPSPRDQRGSRMPSSA